MTHYKKQKNGQYVLEKDGFTPKMTLWSKIKWNLFGEMKILYWWYGAIILIQLVVLGSIIFVAAHFITKYW